MITIGRGVLSRIRKDRHDIVLQVRHADDPEAATAGLRSAAGEIARLDGGWRSARGPDLAVGAVGAGSGPDRDCAPEAVAALDVDVETRVDRAGWRSGTAGSFRLLAPPALPGG